MIRDTIIVSTGGETGPISEAIAGLYVAIRRLRADGLDTRSIDTALSAVLSARMALRASIAEQGGILSAGHELGKRVRDPSGESLIIGDDPLAGPGEN